MATRKSILATGTAGDDSIVGTAGRDRLEGLGGSDTLDGAGDIDTLAGGAGADLLVGRSGSDFLFGNDYDDSSDSAVDTLIGGPGDDTYYVHAADGDVLVEQARGGIDTVFASSAWTLGAHFEHLAAAWYSVSSLLLVGNGGPNRITGSAGNDTLRGLGGNDTLTSAEGNLDLLEGGPGDDVYVVYAPDFLQAGVVIVERPGEGYDELIAQGSSSVTLPDEVEYLLLDRDGLAVDSMNGTGNAGDNRITGNEVVNQLRGGLGDDTLAGAAGADYLSGGGGNDVVSGGLGNDRIVDWGGHDTLRGGDGADRFDFLWRPDPRTNVNELPDFAPGVDRLVFHADAFARIGPPGALDPAVFHLGTAAADPGDRLVYDAATGRLYYDANGSDPDRQVLVAEFAPGTALTAADIWVG